MKIKSYIASLALLAQGTLSTVFAGEQETQDAQALQALIVQNASLQEAQSALPENRFDNAISAIVDNTQLAQNTATVIALRPENEIALTIIDQVEQLQETHALNVQNDLKQTITINAGMAIYTVFNASSGAIEVMPVEIDLATGATTNLQETSVILEAGENLPISTSIEENAFFTSNVTDIRAASFEILLPE